MAQRPGRHLTTRRGTRRATQEKGSCAARHHLAVVLRRRRKTPRGETGGSEEETQTEVFREMYELNEAFERIIEGLRRLEKFPFLCRELVQDTHAEAVVLQVET